MTNSILALEFDDNGDLVGLRDGESADDFLLETGDALWVGVSTNERFNGRFVDGEPAKIAFFGGCFGADGLVAEPLWWRERMDVSDVMSGRGLTDRD